MTQQWIYHGETDDAHVRGAACPHGDCRPITVAYPAPRPLRAEKEPTP